MRLLLLTMVLWFGSGIGAHAAAEPVRVQVSDPYLELRTGAAAEFPIFHIVERGDSVEILMRRTDWFKVRAANGKEGWASREQMERTLTDAGIKSSFRDILLDDYLRRRFHAGVGYGRFDNDPVLVVRAGYQLSPNFAFELAASQVVGRFSTTELMQLNILASPVTDSSLVPYFALGMGPFKNTPKASLVNAAETSATAGNAGFGVQWYITRSFVARADYRRFIVPIDENRVDGYREWTLGLTVFF